MIRPSCPPTRRAFNAGYNDDRLAHTCILVYMRRAYTNDMTAVVSQPDVVT